MAKVRAAAVHAEVARQATQAVGLAVRLQVSPGQPLPLADLVRPPLVEKGALVTLTLEAGGIALSAQGQALEAGADGEHIRVLNPLSRAVMEAQIIGPGRARVEPGSLPLLAPGHAPGPAQVAAR
jgi:flagella basal body P-ring formation protein FlgA